MRQEVLVINRMSLTRSWWIVVHLVAVCNCRTTDIIVYSRWFMGSSQNHLRI